MSVSLVFVLKAMKIYILQIAMAVAKAVLRFHPASMGQVLSSQNSGQALSLPFAFLCPLAPMVGRNLGPFRFHRQSTGPYRAVPRRRMGVFILSSAGAGRMTLDGANTDPASVAS